MNYELCMYFKLFDGCVMSTTVCPPSARRRFLTELFDLLTQEMVASVNNGSFHRSRFSLLPHALNCGRFCFWRRQSVFCLYEISREPLNGFAPYSDEFEGQSQSSKVKVARDTKRHFRSFRRPACSLCLVKHLLPLVLFFFFSDISSL